MFDNPEIDKLIIFALLGMVAVLGIAVIFLAVKKNTYYVDDLEMKFHLFLKNRHRQECSNSLCMKSL